MLYDFLRKGDTTDIKFNTEGAPSWMHGILKNITQKQLDTLIHFSDTYNEIKIKKR